MKSPKQPKTSKVRKIKAWALTCSADLIDISAFENKEQAKEELARISKNSKEDGFTCKHRLRPCTISIKIK